MEFYMEWYKPIIFNYIILANVTNTDAYLDVNYGNNLTVNDYFVNYTSKYRLISEYNPLIVFSFIITMLFVFIVVLYFVFIIDIILRLIFKSNYNHYICNDSTELINATYMNNIKYIKELVSNPHIDVNIVDAASHRTSLEISVINGYLPIVQALLEHPQIHNSVARLEEDINISSNRFQIDRLVQHWHKKQSLCYAAGDGRRLDASFESSIAELTPEELSITRDFNGHTALSNAIQACNLKNMNALLAAGASLLVTADLSGTSLGTIAMKIGDIKLAQILYYKTLKAACRDSHMLKMLRSKIIVGNRVPRVNSYLPREIVNYILEFIVKPTSILDQRTF